MKQTCSSHPVPCLPLLFLLTLTLSATFCNPADDPPVHTVQYPVLFKYQAISFQPSKFYVLTASSSTEIPPSGTYQLADSYLQDELDINDWGFEIEQVELLDASHVRIYFFPALSIVPADTVLTYQQVGDEIQFDFGGTSAEPYRFLWDRDKKTLNSCLQTVQYSHFGAASGEVDYSPFEISNICDDGNPASVIEAQRIQWSLLPGDTVLLNYSGWEYTEQ
jgi:hypothetical protein